LAAWKLYGKALTETKELKKAVIAYEKGVAATNATTLPS